MEKINSLVDNFIDSLNSNIKNSILLVLVYGSRILNTNRDDSDLDILMVINGRINYRIGKYIDGIKCDATLYGINNLYDVILDKRLSNNRYFEAVLNNCYVFMNKDDIMESILNYMEEITYIDEDKRSNNYLGLFYELYGSYINDKSDYNYYNLLEVIRMIAHNKYNASYISLIKVPFMYSNVTYYKDKYKLSLPNNGFIKIFSQCISENNRDVRDMYIVKLIDILNINASRFKDREYSSFYTDDEIKYKMLIFSERIETLKRLANKDRTKFDYIYYNTIRQLYEIYDGTINVYMDNDNYRILELLRIFDCIVANYHFDCNDYVLKLNR